MKKNLVIICGGPSTEHEVSIRSARNIANASSKDRYAVHVLGIDKTGVFHLLHCPTFLSTIPTPFEEIDATLPAVALVKLSDGCYILDVNTGKKLVKVDIVFPIVHGTMGEDGGLQGLLRILGVPFVGPSVMGSSVGMDKELTKRILLQANIPVVPWVTATPTNIPAFKDVQAKLGDTVFIKPACLGSSVGCAKAKTESEYTTAVKEALRLDTKVLIEQSLKPREIECAVLGNTHPIAASPGEIIPSHDFYSYEAKYIDPDGAALKVPASIPSDVSAKIREMAIKVFVALGCEGMSRVDFFLLPDNSIYVNEINTLPGFTNISMYPKMWEYEGVGYSVLIEKLISLGIERFEKEQALSLKFAAYDEAAPTVEL